MTWRSAIPWSLTSLRFLLAPFVLILAWKVEHPQLLLGISIAAALVSDIYDGILARRWGTATAALRVSDTVADTLFYFSILGVFLLRHMDVVRANLGLLIALLITEAARHIFDFIKFRRMASYHTYMAKTWGLLLAAATIAILCFDRFSFLMTIAIGWGILCNIEGLAMSIILPRWTADVKTLARAWKLRQTPDAIHMSA